MSATVAAVFFVALFTQPQETSSPPEALTHLEQSRAALHTGLAEWSLTEHRPGALGFGLEHFRTSRFAQQDVLLIDRGDANGYVETQPGEASNIRRPATCGWTTRLGLIWTIQWSRPASGREHCPAQTRAPSA